jgi:hypothetical protein
MKNAQNADPIAGEIVYKNVMSVNDQFSCACCSTRATRHWMGLKLRGAFGKKFIDKYCRGGVVCFDEFIDHQTIIESLWRPHKHFGLFADFAKGRLTFTGK